MKQINAAFEKANPDITLKYSFIPSAAYPQRVQSELLAGNTADVIMTDSTKVQDWGSSGYLENLSSQPWVSGVRKEIKPFIENSGKTYAMPMEVIGISLFANNTLLKKAGVTGTPTTWPEFEADLQKAKDAGITPLSLPNKGGWTGDAVTNAIAATLVYKNHPSFDADFVKGKASFSVWKSSLQQLMDLQSKGFVDFKSELGVDEWSTGISDFQAGKSAFYVQGAWNQSTFTKAGLDDSFIPWPATSKAECEREPVRRDDAQRQCQVEGQDGGREVRRSSGPRTRTPRSTCRPRTPCRRSPRATARRRAATKTFVAAVNDGRYRILPSNTWLSAAGETTLQQQVQALWLGQQSIDQTVTNLDEKLKPTK